ncbi:aspartyl/asparaginyl beta-hydroxylase domain-containing protein [Kutzneria sp. CA-103260]|uniref:aspartyl/asparaginyl beta-hydroxylase domain-containing protein n=1 Tax=Kutzneria sp. CA-103260 TaxID=2802641 RepID=UPI001BA990D2|nr:aspartyl/asparaginyl beta-hydroxylase domain-containing protein [Kutzneria sp. CA-103260]QUQ67495.1 L-proline cis-4-hydroxylase [Kutzneria sp. CA-103260]
MVRATAASGTRMLSTYTVDTEALARDLATMESFPYTNTYGEFACGHWRSCAAWNGSGDGLHTSLDAYDGPAVLTDLGKQLPYVEELVNRLFDVSLLRFGRIARLTPGSVLVPHRDYLELESDLIRIHLPLETDDSCLNSHENVIYHMNLGEIWFLDATKPHSAFSGWDRDRVHLVLDFKADSIGKILADDPAVTGIPADRTVSRPPMTPAESEAYVAAGALMTHVTHREFLKIAITALFTRDIEPTDVFSLFEAAAERSGDPDVLKAIEPMRAYFLHTRPAA